MICTRGRRLRRGPVSVGRRSVNHLHSSSEISSTSLGPKLAFRFCVAVARSLFESVLSRAGRPAGFRVAMLASGLRWLPDTSPRSSAVSCLKRCYLTAESSNVFFCSRPVPGRAAGTGAGGDAAAFQVLSALLHSHIKRPTLGRGISSCLWWPICTRRIASG